MVNRAAIGLLAALAVWPSPGIHAQARPGIPAGFDMAWRELAAEFHRGMDARQLVGGTVWFVRDSQVLAREFHGLADLATKRRIDENTIYHWASITKTLTGIAIMQLRDRGKLSLDDPVIRFLPELRDAHNPFGPMEKITLRHLMSHSSGFRDPTWPWGGDKPWHPHEPTAWSQLVAMIPYTEILFEPGSRYSYSNPGIIFLGRVIERLTGDDYEVYIDKNILKPLGMFRSYYDITPYHLQGDRSNNYALAAGKLTTNGLDFDTGITTSNGGFNAPIPDMVKYLSFLMGACGDEACVNALKRASIDEMWRAVVPVQPASAGGDTPWGTGWKVSMGLTFFVYERASERLIGHTGSQKAFRTFFYIDPATRTAAIAAFNTTATPTPAGASVFNQLRGHVFTKLFPLFR